MYPKAWNVANEGMTSSARRVGEEELSGGGGQVKVSQADTGDASGEGASQAENSLCKGTRAQVVWGIPSAGV